MKGNFFMFSILDGRDHFFQWDLNQKLIVNDATITEVHFCNKTDNCALVCEVYTENGQRLVNVPNILLQNDWLIRAYAYCTDHTIVEKRFKVATRNKPADYVYTETEVKTWDQMQKNISNSFANALKGYKSGEIIALADVSPIEHELNIKISGVENPKNVIVNRYGLNLFNGERKGAILSDNTFADYDSAPVNNTSYQSIKVYLPVGTYSLNANIPVHIVRRIIDNEWSQLASMNITHEKFTATQAGYVGFTLKKYVPDVNYPAWVDTDKIWITVGATPTEYEPYKEPNTYAVTEDGAVHGIVGTGDSMTLTTDTSGAVVNVEYNRDINKAFAELQNALLSLGGNI